MKIAVFSDTHGNTARMLEAVRALKPDALIHLGDFEKDTEPLRREFPDIPLYSVCGNCDFYPKAPSGAVVELGGVKAFLTHGHLYNVDWSTDSLVYAAQEAGCRIAMYGHTHIPENEMHGSFRAVNPGSVSIPKNGSAHSAVIYENGSFEHIEI